MIAKLITSLQHPLVQHLVKLRQKRDYREAQKRVLVIGEKVVREVASKMPLISLITLEDKVCEDLSAPLIIRGSNQVLKKICGLEEGGDMAAEIALPEKGDLSNKRYILILDRIADPGNLGTILRSALALGWEGVILTPGSVDPYNDKALRAARGATFFLPITFCEAPEILQMIGNGRLLIADARGKTIAQITKAFPLFLLLGNEAHGPSHWAKARGEAVGIPMHEGFESLNVAIASGILMYELKVNVRLG